MKCKACNKPIIDTVGPVKANIVMVGEQPGPEEMKRGRPWVGKGGDVFRKELARIGIQPGSVRLTNLWSHPKPNLKSDLYGPCLNWMATQLIKEIKDKEVVALMGSQVVRMFTNLNVSDVNGLPLTTEHLPHAKLVVAMVNPAAALRGVLGEVRFAMDSFGELSRPYRR